MYKRVSRDIITNTITTTDNQKAPRFENLSDIGSESGFEGNIILNRGDTEFYGHNGTEWVSLTGGGGGGTGAAGPTGPQGAAGIGGQGPDGAQGPRGDQGPLMLVVMVLELLLEGPWSRNNNLFYNYQQK